MKRILFAVGVSTILTFVPGTVLATPLAGEITFDGSAQAVDKSSDPASLDTATGIQFLNPVAVTTATGNFSSYLTPNVSMAQFTSFSFNPLDPSPVNPLWSAGGFSFVLTSIQVLSQNVSELMLTGSGYVTGHNFEATAGTWSFSGFANIGTTSVGQTFSFNATGLASGRAIGVPDAGSTLSLLGLVMAIGLGAASVARACRRMAVAAK